MFFSKIFQILFIIGSTFPILIPEYLNNSWWCFSSSFSDWKTEEDFSLNLAPFSSRFVVLVQGHPLIIVFDCQNSFHPSGVIQSIFSLILRSPSSHNYSFPAFSYRSPNLTGASINYPLISSWSLRSHVTKFSQASSFIC